MWFLYDSDGTRVGFSYKDTDYFYTKNAPGDVPGITDSNCNTVVEYSYDAWGKLLSTTGSMVDTIGKLNPFLYRGYYFDAETGLYYLNSRYYDARTGRFISADGIIGANQDMIRYDLFAYCSNNPINSYDPTGEESYPIGFIGPKQTVYTHCFVIGKKSFSASINTKSPPPSGTGYKAPKNPDKGKKRVPASGARGETGWLDKKGNVWVPDVDMDGGEGWRRHYPDGSHDHVYPNGKIRAHAITWDPVSQGLSFTDQISAATRLSGASLALYLIISEGTRVIPVRNLVPLP